MNRKKWLLQCLHRAGEKGLSPVQLQKVMFLLAQNLPNTVGAEFYSFIPYNYGPFCVDIYADAEQLQKEGLVEIRREDRRWPQYYCTPEGHIDAEAQDAPADGVRYLSQLVEWAQARSFQEIVRSIYEYYPDFKANSVFSE